MDDWFFFSTFMPVVMSENRDLKSKFLETSSKNNILVSKFTSWYWNLESFLLISFPFIITRGRMWDREVAKIPLPVPPSSPSDILTSLRTIDQGVDGFLKP